MSSFVKYRLKEVAADFGVTTKEISQILEKYSEKPKSNTQVLTEAELNTVFEYVTRNNQVSSLAVVFDVKPQEKAEPKAEPKAEAAKQEAILQAEGEALARIRVAEAEAKAIELITEAVGKSTNPANYLLAQKYIQMMQELAEGDKTKTVYMPYEATNLLGSIGGIKDLFKATE